MKVHCSKNLPFCLNNSLKSQANHPAMHSVEVSRRRIRGCGFWCWWPVTGETQHVTLNMWHMTHDIWYITHFWVLYFIFWYSCNYTHTLRDSLSPVCRIFVMIGPPSTIMDFFLIFASEKLTWFFFVLRGTKRLNKNLRYGQNWERKHIIKVRSSQLGFSP